jgi:imidazolonepropionase-like amidohydrolase
MRTIRIVTFLLVPALSLLTLSQPRQRAILFEGARLITGDGRSPIEDSAFLVDGGSFVRIGRRGQVRPSAADTVRVDLTGKTVIPALINMHGHLGYLGASDFAAENYTRETIVDQLERYAYHGVGAVLTLGTDPGRILLDLREDQRMGKAGGAHVLTAGRGLAAPDAGPNFPPMKPSAYGIETEEQARKAVRELAG